MNNKQNEAVEQLLPEIKRAARQISFEWYEVISAEDAEQDIVVSLLSDNYATQVVAMEPAARRTVLNKIAQHVAVEERTDYEHFTGNFRYSTTEIRSHLENEALNNNSTSVEHVDIRVAVEKLSNVHRRVLFDRFVHATADMSNGDGRKKVTRAVDALTDEVNRSIRRRHYEYDGPGSRKATSNASMMGVIRNQDGAE